MIKIYKNNFLLRKKSGFCPTLFTIRIFLMLYFSQKISAFAFYLWFLYFNEVYFINYFIQLSLLLNQLGYYLFGNSQSFDSVWKIYLCSILHHYGYNKMIIVLECIVSKFFYSNSGKMKIWCGLWKGTFRV